MFIVPENFKRPLCGGTWKLKSELFQARSPSLKGGQDLIMQIVLLVLTKKFQRDYFKISLLGYAKTAIVLGIKSWQGWGAYHK